jgi:hypothetical protein
LDEVFDKVLPLEPTEVFCEVLNPKGNNLGMMRDALANDYPHLAKRLHAYSPVNWASFTWETLDYGYRRSPLFIPWPDAKRGWRKHIPYEQCRFLEGFLPEKC